MTTPARFQAIAMMLLAMTLIVTGDTAGKLLTAAGFSPFFIGWSRFVLGALLLLPFSGLTRAELPSLLNWRVLLRSVLIACTVSSILSALRTEPIANVFGAFFIGPLISYFLSALVLKERISWVRTILLFVGFSGVVLVVKPGFGMTPGMGFAVLAGTFYGTFLVSTRWLAGEYRPRFLLISQLMIAGVLITPLAIGPIPTLDIRLISLIGISALASALGNLLFVLVSRTTPASVIAPLIYSQLLAATIIGFLVFGDWPDALSLVGLVTIMATGVASFWLAGREK